MEPRASQLPHAQSSIRSFFQPRVPSYTTPPSTTAPPRATSTTPITTPTANLSLNGRSEENIYSAPKHSALPSQATISTVHDKHIQPLRRINSLLLQINYPDSFYHGILSPDTSPSLSRVILWQDPAPRVKSTDQNGIDLNPNSGEATPPPEPKVIGGIVCRMEQSEDGRYSVYIQSLALLSPYRSKGLATALLDAIIESITTQSSPTTPVTSLYAHVWKDNSDGLEWYAQRGFYKDGPLIQGYYRKLNPDSAWILRRAITPRDHLSHLPTGPQAHASSTSPNGSRPPSANPPPPQAGPPPQRLPRAIRPATNLQHTSSFQNRAPDTEWNDLPEDILTPAGSRTVTPSASTTSLMLPVGEPGSRSSSTGRGTAGKKEKKKREYPAAAFGA